jgi:hypothetical protein
VVVTDPGPPQEPPRHPGRHRGTHAAPPTPLRLLVRSFLAIAVVAGLVALLINLRGSPTTSTSESPGPGPVITSPTPSVLGTPSASPSPKELISPGHVPPRSTPTASPTPTRVVAPLFVANNTREKGKAHRAAAQFHAGGWPISGTGNYRGQTISETTAYYPPGNDRLKAAAESLRRQFPQVRRVAPRFAGLPGSGVVVVVTASYPA